ncbi:MAG: VanZ family protein [Rikenellaceae bacterium]
MLNIILTNKKIALTAFVAYFFLVIFLSLHTFEQDPDRIKIENFDKFVHFCFYFGMSILFMHLLNVKPIKNKKFMIPITLVFVVFVGVAIEFVQPHFNRSSDVFDVVANSTGTVVGTILYTLIAKKTKCLKFL